MCLITRLQCIITLEYICTFLVFFYSYEINYSYIHILLELCAGLSI